MNRIKHIWPWLILSILAVLVFVGQILVGSFPISIPDLILCINSKSANAVRDIIWQSRMPAALAAIAGGAALSLAGLQMQTYFRNPVAGPFVLGISSGASLGAAVYIMLSSQFGCFFTGDLGLIMASSLGAISVFILISLLSFRLKNAVSMLIVGLMVASFVSAVVETIQTLSTPESIRTYLFWTMGSFRNISLNQIPLLMVILLPAFLISTLLVKPLNLLLAGEENARLSGLNPARARFMVILSTCLYTAAVTAFCGPVGFVGLAVPHIARGIFRTSDHRVLFPAVIFIGAIVCGMCNLLTGISIHGLVLPINTITSLLGAPFVIWIIFRSLK